MRTGDEWTSEVARRRRKVADLSDIVSTDQHGGMLLMVTDGLGALSNGISAFQGKWQRKTSGYGVASII